MPGFPADPEPSRLPLAQATVTVRVVGGRIICPESGLDDVATLDLSGEAVAAVHHGSPPPAPGALVLDAGGLVVAPGLIDLHVELGEPGLEHRETLDAGLRAAVRGGFSRVCTSPQTDPPVDHPAAVRALLQRATEVGLAGVLPVAALSRGLRGAELAELYALADAGAVAFSDGDRSLDDAGLWRRALEYARASMRPVFEFPEDGPLAGDGVMHEGPTATRLGLRGVPAAAEDVRAWRALALAEQTGAHIHLGPVTTRGAVRVLRLARAMGLPLTAAASATHLHLTDRAVAEGPDGLPYDARLRLRPPLRPRADRDAVREAVAEGLVEAVTSLHRPRARAEKAGPFDAVAPGAIGLQTALGLVLRCAEEDRWPFATVIARLSTGPASIVRRGDLGRLAPGARADVVIFDPLARSVVVADELASRASNSPWIGQSLPGRVRWTLVDGRVVYDAGPGRA